MGFHDRDYAQEHSQARYYYAPQMRMGFPRLTPAVKWLLIINISVFLVDAIFFRTLVATPIKAGAGAILTSPLEKWFSVFPYSFRSMLQLWRLITYQFLHGGTLHIFFNMLVLFFLGPTLEQSWGSKKFLTFYLACGAAGGLFYLLLVAVDFLAPLPMVGASGAMLGMLAACAILFPHFVVFLFVFPVPIRAAVIIFTVLYLFNLATRGANAGGDAAHLAGMAAGAAYVLSEPWRAGVQAKIQSGRWEKRRQKQHNLQIELDRILQKVYESGIRSLTSKEKRILRKATEAEQGKNTL